MEEEQSDSGVVSGRVLEKHELRGRHIIGDDDDEEDVQESIN